MKWATKTHVKCCKPGARHAQALPRLYIAHCLRIGAGERRRLRRHFGTGNSQTPLSRADCVTPARAPISFQLNDWVSEFCAPSNMAMMPGKQNSPGISIHHQD